MVVCFWVVVVICCIMLCVFVVLDGDVIFILFELYLGIVVLCYYVEEVFKEDV